MSRRSIYILMSLGGAVLLLWQLLLPGYILTLDMVFGQRVVWPAVGSLLNVLPLTYLRSLFVFALGGWVTQKLLLGFTFFLLVYLPLRYFKRIFLLERTYGAEFVAALAFAINPFVYERFLAGQWLVLFGYALLIPAFAYAYALVREYHYRNTLKLAATLLLMGVFSIHFLTITAIIATLCFGIALLIAKQRVAFLKRLVLLGVLVLIGSSYWLVPAIQGTATPLPTFTSEHFEVFKTAGDERIGTVGNVLILHGFWGEHEEWVERFVLPKNSGLAFWIPAVAFALVVFYGLFIGLRAPRWRLLTLSLSAIACISVVLSVGVGDSMFQVINQWLFEHVSFWKGFRDTQKWSGVIALVYALFGGLGAYGFLSSSWFKQYQLSGGVALATLPLLCTPMMLFGFAGQLHTVQYPPSWKQVDEIIMKDETCKALFLPWHQYYSLKFNDDIVVANTAPAYFHCEIVSGKNMELGSIESQGGNGQEYDTVEPLVTDNSADPDAVIETLKAHDFDYIIMTDDVQLEDQFDYPFLKSSKIKVILKGNGITLYSLE